jgi:hypothetical protein
MELQGKKPAAKTRFSTISINEHLEDATAIIIQSITDEIIKDFK